MKETDKVLNFYRSATEITDSSVYPEDLAELMGKKKKKKSIHVWLKNNVKV